MREDMYKVIVERPRRGKEGDAIAARLRKDLDGPMRLGTRAGYGYRSLNENLAPLRRYLQAQIGRPWNKVFSEICAGIDRRNTVQQHIHQHIRDFIAVDVDICEGRLVDLSARWGFLRRDSGISQELYVDPRTGLIRPNYGYRSWRHGAAERHRREQAEIATRRRMVDEHTFLLLLDDVWFRVEVDLLPKERFAANIVDSGPHKRVIAEARYDVVLRRHISRAMRSELQQCRHLYGSDDLYAVSKRQLSTREIKAHRLR
ncbi:MAG TPA: hypothetical protein VGG49_00525 [Steroidobacteraceae bacterium]|jgi:hypothetical protein